MKNGVEHARGIWLFYNYGKCHLLGNTIGNHQNLICHGM